MRRIGGSARSPYAAEGQKSQLSLGIYIYLCTYILYRNKRWEKGWRTKKRRMKVPLLFRSCATSDVSTPVFRREFDVSFYMYIYIYNVYVYIYIHLALAIHAHILFHMPTAQSAIFLSLNPLLFSFTRGYFFRWLYCAFLLCIQMYIYICVYDIIVYIYTTHTWRDKNGYGLVESFVTFMRLIEKLCFMMIFDYFFFFSLSEAI